MSKLIKSLTPTTRQIDAVFVAFVGDQNIIVKSPVTAIVLYEMAVVENYQPISRQGVDFLALRPVHPNENEGNGGAVKSNNKFDGLKPVAEISGPFYLLGYEKDGAEQDWTTEAAKLRLQVMSNAPA